MLLWLWCRPASTALIRPLALEPPYAAGAALEKANTHTHTHTHTEKQKKEPTFNRKEVKKIKSQIDTKNPSERSMKLRAGSLKR